mgnify:CR=1 FL=1
MSEDSKTNKDSSRYCLLQSAAKLFSKNGLEKTSTRDISQESKVNISMISYHFGGKEGLYKQVRLDFAKNRSWQYGNSGKFCWNGNDQRVLQKRNDSGH